MKLNYRGGFSYGETHEVKLKLRSNILQRLAIVLTEIEEKLPETAAPTVTVISKASSQEYEFMQEEAENFVSLTKAVVEALEFPEVKSYVTDHYFDAPWDFSLFSRASTILSKGYQPTPQDILMCRSPTTGLHEYSFIVDNVELVFIDVGGQRKERATWAKAMENIGAVIYVASLAEYGIGLEEDNTKDRMIESLELFQRVFHSPKLAKIPTVLLLNKFDLLEQRLNMLPLSAVFTDYSGPDQDIESAYEFISSKFIHRTTLKPTEKEFVCERVCAIDQDNFMKVFQIIKAMLVSSSLRASGLG